MKNIITSIFSVILILIAGNTNAQVVIGKTAPVIPTNSNTLLEFGNDNKGIIIPSVTSVPTDAVGGTFIFNTIDKAIEVYEGRNDNKNGGWTKLSNENEGIPHNYINSGTTDTSSPAGVIIGSDKTTKSGALVLESTTQALVLPKVANPHLTIKGAIAGTIVFDTTSNSLAVYDGANWSYWK